MTHQTINGPIQIVRTVYWSSQTGMVAPADRWLGISQSRYSPGLREMVCRLSLNEAFVPAAANLKRLVQVTVSSSAKGTKPFAARQNVTLSNPFKNTWPHGWT